MDKLKILVVDDETRMRKLVKDFLVKNNYEVVEAEDGEKAVDIFFNSKDISLIILDVGMYHQKIGFHCLDHKGKSIQQYVLVYK